MGSARWKPAGSSSSCRRETPPLLVTEVDQHHIICKGYVESFGGETKEVALFQIAHTYGSSFEGSMTYLESPHSSLSARPQISARQSGDSCICTEIFHWFRRGAALRELTGVLLLVKLRGFIFSLLHCGGFVVPIVAC